ncbi:DUF3379 family protein [Solemya velum gill symbiont]|uniref:DUF3379 family protein n=1 Tax=Solemya velum gill symbiont TaxID=2340 RepID=UPI000995EFDF|nr:DUF3379 family protein [Solemya velum gill symbiont]OOZ43862.1 hypothetical protein BOW37_09085 [Solemya velum gill symbiont]OOZ45966.1 hypothetical protein BOW38_08740 [Solemya velum gill symbiont]OOZ48671.1 hypothetical protein BOW39_09635 [Solemya velum gill symbiont]OOZ51017.1 hypothetical protein BOW40_09015 [Solemya velum gill symbiont]OOZ53710.1 hypothetical protein BOW41_09015 [Solemya velum gill symbiont]
MNEIEFRKQCVIDPNSEDERFVEAMQDSELHKIREEYLDFDAQLKDAMRLQSDFDPESLKLIPQEMDEEHAKEESSWFKSALRPAYSIAASFVAAMVVVFGLLLQPEPALSESMMDHLYDHMEVTHIRTKFPQQKLRPLLDEYGIRISEVLTERMRHASKCELENLTGLHIVFDGESGPVTLFFMPGAEVDRASMMGREQFHGILFQHGDGAVGIIGVMDEQLLPLKDEVEASLVPLTPKKA